MAAKRRAGAMKGWRVARKLLPVLMVVVVADVTLVMAAAAAALGTMIGCRGGSTWERRGTLGSECAFAEGACCGMRMRRQW